MKKSEKIYKKLSQSLSDSEIVESYVFNDDSMSDAEQEIADKEFRELRLKQLSEITDSERLYGQLMKMKFQIKDYFKEDNYDEQFSFSSQLKKYSKLISRSNREFSEDLGIHHTKISRLLNGKENPNIELMYRLDEHSDGELPAHYWWRLHSRDLEHRILTDTSKRTEESMKVKNALKLRA